MRESIQRIKVKSTPSSLCVAELASGDFPGELGASVGKFGRARGFGERLGESFRMGFPGGYNLRTALQFVARNVPTA